MEQTLKDRVAIVVGSSSGMGAATARTYAAAGARVVLAARSVDRLHELSDEIGEAATVCETDVTDAASAKRLVEAHQMARRMSSSMEPCYTLSSASANGASDNAIDLVPNS